MMNCVVRLSISFVLALTPLLVRAEAAAPYESQLIDRWVDFENRQKSRMRSKVQEDSELDEIRQRRRDTVTQQERLRAQHVARMKRYSMEEAERLEAENEKKSDEADRKMELAREERIRRRNVLLEIERRIGRIDSNIEYDIDMVKEPESKTSWSDFKPAVAGEGRESF